MREEMINKEIALKLAESLGPELLVNDSPGAKEGFRNGLILASLVGAGFQSRNPTFVMASSMVINALYGAIVQRRKDTGHPAGYYCDGVDDELTEIAGQLQRSLNVPLSDERQSVASCMKMLSAIEARKEIENGIKGYSLEELLGESEPVPEQSKTDLKDMWN